MAESFVLQGLDALQRLPDEFGEDVMMLVTASQVAKVGGIFVLDPGDNEAIASLEITPDLPPLPFSQCWFEVWNEDVEMPCALNEVRVGNTVYLLMALAILEVEPANLWSVVAQLATRDGHGIMRRWTIRSKSLAAQEELDTRILGTSSTDLSVEDVGLPVVGLSRQLLADAIEEDAAGRAMLFLPVEIGHLVTILGSEPRPFTVPRARRREFQRRYSLEHPQVYTVSLRGAGETHVGAGDREYHHRWIVRGHYRRDPHGRFNVLGKGTCTWVRPYVKGPADAPWKGRPLYRSAE